MKKNSVTKPTKKHYTYKALFKVLRVSVLLGCGGIGFMSVIFLNISHHKRDLQLMVHDQTGYYIDYDRLVTGFTWYGQPYIKINGLCITAPKHEHVFFSLKRLELTFSYRSLWQQKLIFDQLTLDNSALNIEYDKNSNLLLNGQIITNLQQPTDSKFNFANWLSAQGNINVKNIDILLYDSKHNILPLIIDDFELAFNHAGRFNDQLIINTKVANNKLNLQLNYSGSDIADFTTWDDGVLHVKSVGNLGYLFDLKANVHNKQLNNIIGTLDSNQHVLNSYSADYSRVNNFKGKLYFNKVVDNKYQLNVNDLNIATNYGYLFNNATIHGDIDFGKSGTLDINNFKLAGLTSLLRYIKNEQRLKLDGDINTIHVHWIGRMRDPQQLKLDTTFANVSLQSKIDKVPSFNNLSGQIHAEKESGNVQLHLKQSKILAPQIFKSTLDVTQMLANINWTIESQNQLRLDWNNTNLTTPDFNLTSNGTYKQAESNLTCNIAVKKVNLAEVYKYLPLTTDKELIDDLHKNLTGEISNAQITINGNPTKIPFATGDGKLNIQAKLNNVSYLYAYGWPKVTNLSGDVTESNQKVKFVTTNATINNLHIKTGSSVSIDNIAAKLPQLNGVGSINSTTEDFINFLINTPLRNDVASINNTANVNGQASVDLKFSMPINTPNKLLINGKYHLTNNKISLKSDNKYQLDNTSGTLNFNQKGLENGALTSQIFDSPLQISIPNQNEVNINAKDFNYDSLIKASGFNLTDIIHGNATTNLHYDLNTKQLAISSNLESVEINAPAPLAKNKDWATAMNINVDMSNDTYNATMNYNDILFANLDLTSNLAINKLKIGLGASDLDLAKDNNSQITLKARLENTYILDWAKFVDKIQTDLQSTIESNNIESTAIEYNTQNESSTESATTDNKDKDYSLINIEWNSNAFWLDKYNLDGGQALMSIYPDLLLGQISTPDIQGRAAFSLADKQLDIDLDRLLISSYNLQKKESSLSAEIYALNESDNILMTKESNTTQVTEAYAELSNLSTESGFKSISSLFESSNQDESSESINEAPTQQIPAINFRVHNLYIQNSYFGDLQGNLYQQHNDIYLDNASIKNKSGITRFNMLNHCFSCANHSDEYVALNVHSDINNFGTFLVKANQSDMFKNGNGFMDISAFWDGSLTDFDLQNVIAYANMNINDGVLVKIKPGLFGTLMGVINFSALNITNMNHFNFNSFFGQSFAFKNLNTNLYLENNDLRIEKLDLSGDVADVSTFGDYYIESKNIDTYLTITPKISGTIATTAGIITLNPIIGGVVYLVQKLIGDPINKMLAISYHVQGDVDHPTMKQTTISKQVLQNMKSSVKLLPSEETN